MLGELAVLEVDDLARRIEEQRANAGGAGIEGEEEGHVRRRYRGDGWVARRTFSRKLSRTVVDLGVRESETVDSIVTTVL